MLSLILSQFTQVGWLYKTAGWLQFFENEKHVSAARMACLGVFVGALSIFARLGSCQEQNSSVIYGSGGENTKKSVIHIVDIFTLIFSFQCVLKTTRSILAMSLAGDPS